MAELKELAEFVDSVLRLDVGTPVRGFDGFTIGPSNEQAQALANRTRWLKERIQEILDQYVKTVNGKSSIVDLTFLDVGAEEAGVAAQLISSHEEATDPHPGYLNKTRGDLLYLKPSDANTPGGFLQLDSAGKIPADAADGFKARYSVVQTEEERLALPKHDDLTICAQLNGEGEGDDQLYYLNAGDNPADSTKWIAGKSAVLQGVTSAFGRTGIVIGQVGDYNADQITETADRSFLTPTMRDLFLGKQDPLVSGENIRRVCGYSLLGSGNLQISYEMVGAEEAGKAAALVSAHEAKQDPHTNYFNQVRGDARYVQQSNGNKPNGFLQLDENGQVPPNVIEVLKAQYVMVDTEEERLALPMQTNLTICIQLNGPGEADDRLYYLNADKDPSNPDNWYAGQSATVVGATSIFGRTGVVEAQAGDYDADQITETAGRIFISPTEKAAFTAKQDKLVSGTNIKSLWGVSLLGGGNYTPTPATMGAAAAKHSHTVEDITDWGVKTSELIGNSWEAGDGITIGYNPITKKTIISAPGSGGGSGSRTMVRSERTGATAGQVHTFQIPFQDTFDFLAFALKEEAGATNQVGYTENLATSAVFNTTPFLNFNGEVNVVLDGILDLVAAGDGYYKADARTDAGSIAVDSRFSPPLVPEMTSNTAPGPVIISQSTSYTSAYQGYNAFNGKTLDGTRWSGNGVPQWLGVQFPTTTSVYGYMLTSRSDISYGGDPKNWVFQGSNNGTDWVDLDTQVGIVWKATEEKRFYLAQKANYPYYRIYITAAQGDPSNLCTITLMNLYDSAGKIILQDSTGKNYKAVDGKLIRLSDNITDIDIQKDGFDNSGTILASALEGVGQLKAVSNISLKAVYKVIPYAQMFFKKELTDCIEWASVVKGTVTGTVTGTGAIRIAVTRDNKKFYTFNPTTTLWEEITNFTVDSVGAQKLMDRGMTMAVYTAISAANWKKLFSDAAEGNPDKLTVVYGLSVSDLASSAIVKTSVVSVNSTSSWILQTPAQVEVRWKKSTVSFKTITAGNYKLAYEIP